MVEIDKVTSIRIRQSTKDKLDVYKRHYGTYEKGILELIKSFEEPLDTGHEPAPPKDAC